MSNVLQELAPGVHRVSVGPFCCYFLGAPGEPWVVVDTGTPGSTAAVVRTAEVLFGEGSKPSCILLTHGHFDHAGSAAELADLWEVPVYAHQRELPFLTGKTQYPPADPTIGGFFSLILRFMPDPNPAYNLGARVKVLPEDGAVPGLSGWRWLHTPGHTPGHVAYFRTADRILLTGDSLALVDFNSVFGVVFDVQKLSLPSPPITSDWEATRDSIRALARLEPSVIAPGHGKPLVSTDTALQLKIFAANLTLPKSGRYVKAPAVLTEEGLINLPPAPPDPFALNVLRAGALCLAALTAILAFSKKSRSAE